MGTSLTKASEEDLASIEGIGPEIAGSAYAYLNERVNQLLIQRLRTAGLQVSRGKKEATGNQNFEKKTFVITGKLPTWTRPQAAEFIKQNGGKVISSISSKTDFVVVGESPGSKIKKARALKVQEISEEELKKLVN